MVFDNRYKKTKKPSLNYLHFTSYKFNNKFDIKIIKFYLNLDEANELFEDEDFFVRLEDIGAAEVSFGL